MNVYERLNGSYGSIADILRCPHSVRFTPMNGHSSAARGSDTGMRPPLGLPYPTTKMLASPAGIRLSQASAFPR
jgi:hypothetical protein